MTSLNWSTLRTQIRGDILNDTSASSYRWSDAQLLRMVNDGLRSVYPHIFERVTDSTTEVTETTGISDYLDREYSLPSGVPDKRAAEPVWMVQVGPIGGDRNSDGLQYSDQYHTLRSKVPQAPAWWVDYDRRKLILPCGASPFGAFYDDSDTYDYFLRIHYVRPLTLLTADADTVEGPEEVIPVLEHYVAIRAFMQRFRSGESEAESIANLGAILKAHRDEYEAAMRNARMKWPSKVV